MATSLSNTEKLTNSLLDWFQLRASENGGVIPVFKRITLPAVLKLNPESKPHRVIGNVQSRIDYACFTSKLPPLGLVAEQPYERAWATNGRTWRFPVAGMTHSARAHSWTSADFDSLRKALTHQTGVGFKDWQATLKKDENSVKNWAFSYRLLDEPVDAAPASTRKRPARHWSRDELILALALYLPNRSAPPGKQSVEVKELSQFLNKMGAFIGLVDADTYRNPNGVYMKMMNFRSLDPFYTSSGKVGLTKRNKDERPVWDRFSTAPEELQEVAAAIRAAVENADMESLPDTDEDPDFVEAEEGRVLSRLHRTRERNRKLVEACKKAAMKKHKRLACEACKFEFAGKYGDTTQSIIDVHHTRPVHTLEVGEKTKLKDLVLLCANCHRVVHSRKKWLSIEQIKELLKGTQEKVPTAP